MEKTSFNNIVTTVTNQLNHDACGLWRFGVCRRREMSAPIGCTIRTWRAESNAPRWGPVRADLPEHDRGRFAGHSLRACLASSPGKGEEHYI
jgi:hypothetical protein